MSRKANFSFKLDKQDKHSRARSGSFRTAHGVTLTPAFMPVATSAVLRGLPTEILKDLGYQTILANTYHLLLRPGQEVFEKSGGIHNFMKWERSVLTDSGGFQIFSMPNSIRISEEGATFRSYTDGKHIMLSPEKSIAMQRAINSDIMMVLDQCIPSLADRSQATSALELTRRWALRSWQAAETSEQALFGIIQGACFPDLRSKSASHITELDFDGYAIGGVAVGEEKSVRDDIIAHTAALLPADRPRYVMGIGTPADLLEAVNCGIDMFDCILPSSLAQQGVCFTSAGKIDLRRGVYKMCDSALDKNCSCQTCRTYSRAYLHHLVKAKEFVAGTLLSIHNLTFYHELVKKMRLAIETDSFSAFYLEQKSSLLKVDPEFPRKTAAKPRKIEKNSLGNYTIIKQDSYSAIQHIASGEVMHSVSNPEVEAKRLYIDQSGLCEQVLAHNNDYPALILWDVGLGAGHNAMAAIRAYESCINKTAPIRCRKLQMISFENDLDSFRLALSRKNDFPHLKHPAPERLIKEKVWKSASTDIEWNLQFGDFTEMAANAPAPDIVFYDPFSYKTNPSLWNLNVFELLFSLSKQGLTRIYTYSASTAVRSAMLAAGFLVAKGRGTGPKKETTIALHPGNNSLSANSELLGKDWLARWERSQNRYPAGLNPAQTAEIDLKIRQHPQFSDSFISEGYNCHKQAPFPPAPPEIICQLRKFDILSIKK